MNIHLSIDHVNALRKAVNRVIDDDTPITGDERQLMTTAVILLAMAEDGDQILVTKRSDGLTDPLN